MPIIAFTHPSLNKMGGAEKMALETIKILIEAGYNIHLYTIGNYWKQNGENTQDLWRNFQTVKRNSNLDQYMIG